MAGIFEALPIEMLEMARSSCGLEAIVAFFFDELAAIFEEEAEGVEVEIPFHGWVTRAGPA